MNSAGRENAARPRRKQTVVQMAVNIQPSVVLNTNHTNYSNNTNHTKRRSFGIVSAHGVMGRENEYRQGNSYNPFLIQMQG
jgi:hypothetical protein